MKKIAALLSYASLLMGLWISVMPVAAQSQPPLTKRESDNISFLAKERLKLLNELLNQLTDQDLEAFGKDFLIKGSSQPTSANQVFYNDLVTIEDDIDPSHTSADNTADVSVDKYLNNLALFYTKTLTPTTIVFSKQYFFPVQQNGDLLFIKGFFTSTFKGKHTKIDKPYLPANRVVEMRADKVNNKWQVRVIRLGFARPGEGSNLVAQAKPVSATGGPGGVNDTGRPVIPDDLSINSAEVPFRQPDDNVLVTLKFNRSWLQVVQSGSADIPLGFYQRRDNVYVFDKLNSIEFQKNNTQFVFHKGLEYKGYERVLPERINVTKPDSVVKPAVITAAPKPVALPDTARSVATRTKKEKAKKEKPVETTSTPQISSTTAAQATNQPDSTKRVVASRPVLQKENATPAPPRPTVVESPRMDTSRTVALTPVVEPPVKKKPEKPIIAVSAPKPSAPDLGKSLSAEAQRRKARYRAVGWLQVVAGVAGLAGSYLTYSSIKNEYAGYTDTVDKLNAEYNAWREVARQPSGSAMEPMSLTNYGKPGIYGAYAGGGISLGLLLNGIRTLGKAGKVKNKR